jgi:hypothetical protein
MMNVEKFSEPRDFFGSAIVTFVKMMIGWL